jgi:hypothetical protein
MAAHSSSDARAEEDLSERQDRAHEMSNRDVQ